MASISNTVNGGLLQAPKSQANKPINWGSVNVKPPQAPTKPQAPAYTPPTTSGTASPVRGVVNPDYGAFQKSLQNIQGGLSNLQKERDAKTFPNIVGGLMDVAKPSSTQTGLVQGLTSASAPSAVQTGLVQNISGAAAPSSVQRGLVTGLQDVGAGNTAIANEAKRISDEYGQRIAETGALGAGKAAGDLSTGTQVVGEGNAAIASQSASQRMSALAAGQTAALQGTGQQLTGQSQYANALGAALSGANTQQQQQLGGLGTALSGASTLQSQQLSGLGAALGGANTQQQQQLSGLGSAAGLAQPSGTFPFVFNPLTGQFNTGGSNLSPEAQVGNYAQEVASGARTYNDAVAAMSVYGNAGKQLLDQAIRAVQPDFNFSQAQALQDVQGNVSPALNMAQSALQNLQNTFEMTPAWQRTGVPALNSLANMAGAIGIGTGTATSKSNAINEARTQVANALGTMTNSTPTSWVNMVNQWFPDNATPDQVAAGIEQFNNLAQNRQSIFGAPGQVQPFQSSKQDTYVPTTNNQFDW